MSSEYALLINGVFQQTRTYPERPEDIPHKGVAWYPVFRETGPEAFEGVGDDKYIICTVDPALLPPPVPALISPRQMRIMLARSGLLATVEQAIAASSSEVQIEWEYATEVRRDWPLVNQLASLIGLSSAQVDQMFIAAAAI